MAQLKYLGGGTLAAALLCSSAALAQVTPEDVWKGWVGYYTDLGMTVTSASEARDGDVLVVSEVVLSGEKAVGADTNTFSATVQELRLTDMGDGTVEITMSGEVPLVASSRPAEGEDVDMAFTFAQTDLSVLVSGSPEDMIYDFTAPHLGLKSGNLTVEGAPQDVIIDIAMTGNKGQYRMITGGGRSISSQVTTEEVVYSFAATDAETKGSFKTAGTLTGVSGATTFAMPEGADTTDMSAALQAGLMVDGTFGFTASAGQSDFADQEQVISATSSGEAGNVHFAMSKDGMSYGGDSAGSTLSLSGPAMPFPVDLAIGNAIFNIALPVSSGEAAQPFDLVLKLEELSASDTIWSMFDPTAQLPHDPATLIVELSGAAKMLVDIFDPAMAEATAMPGEIESVTLSALELSVAGASLTGNGAVDFDNSTGVPTPTGAVDLQLVGGNRLIDALVAMGMIPDDQAQGARLMMGLFGVAAGEDTLTSKIEFKDDGGIYANGQRVQ